MDQTYEFLWVTPLWEKMDGNVTMIHNYIQHLTQLKQNATLGIAWLANYVTHKHSQPQISKDTNTACFAMILWQEQIYAYVLSFVGKIIRVMFI